MIQEEVSKQDDEVECVRQQKEEKSRGSRSDPTEDENGRILFATRYGEVYHLQEDCRNTNGYVKYQKYPCKDCKKRSSEVFKFVGSSSSSRDETKLFVATKDRYYHRPTCERLLNVKHQDKRVPCIICEKRNLQPRECRRTRRKPR